MEIDPNEVTTVTLSWDNPEGDPENYPRKITRRQIGELLLAFDDMADTTALGEDD